MNKNTSKYKPSYVKTSEGRQTELQLRQDYVGQVREIPEGWKKVSISHIAEIISGGTPKTKEKKYWNGKIPWLSVVDFNTGKKYVYNTEKSITEEGVRNSSTNILDKGMIIISARGTVGAIAQLAKPMAFNQSCYGLNAKSSTTNDFLYYLLLNSIKTIKSSTHGSVFDTIIRKTFDEIHINFPPKEEQHSIASILSSLDSKIELNRKINETLEEIGKALFKHWFIDFNFPWDFKKNKFSWDGKAYKRSGGKMKKSDLELIPEDFEVVNLKEVIRTQYGYTQSASEEKIGPKFIRVKDINKKDWINWDEVPYCKISKKKYVKYKLAIGDILIARMADPGKVAIIEQKINSVFASYLIRLQIRNEDIQPYYLFYYLNSFKFQAIA